MIKGISGSSTARAAALACRLLACGLLTTVAALSSPAAAQQQAPETAPPSEDVPTDVPPPKTTTPDSPVPAPQPTLQVTGVILQGLDKVTARISTIQVPIDGTAQFGTLVIRARTCKLAPPDAPPDASAFLEISDVPPDQTNQAKVVFSGWMFASTPALSALEHPVYDVWVKTCMTAAPSKP